MKKYIAKINLDVELDAFSEEDAKEYLSDIFSVDDEVKQVNIVSIKEK